MLLTTLLGVALLITSGDGLSGDQTAPPRIQAPSHVGGTPEDVLRPPAPIRVLSTSASIDFPDELVLRLEAESDSRIERIRLDYQIGGQTVRTYGYPRFTPSKRVSADFVIETDGARYLPSGADIAYTYTIENAAGARSRPTLSRWSIRTPPKSGARGTGGPDSPVPRPAVRRGRESGARRRRAHRERQEPAWNRGVQTAEGGHLQQQQRGPAQLPSSERPGDAGSTCTAGSPTETTTSS